MKRTTSRLLSLLLVFTMLVSVMSLASAAGTEGTATPGAKSVAEYNGTEYNSLQEAIDEASQKNGGQTEVTLLSNVTITETINFVKKYSAGSVLLNLGGYTLTGEGCRALQISKGNLYLQNGTVTSTGIINSSSVIRIGSNEDAYSGVSPMLYMQKDAKVLAPDSYGVTIFGSKTVSENLTVASNASVVATGPSPAISGNGDKAYHVDGKGTKIIITDTAVVSATNNYAIYHPDNGSVSIQSSATVSGKGGIQMCSGTLNISGSSKIEALGKADHETGAAGPIYDIAAISAVDRSYPGGAPVVTIKDTPTITTVDGEVIHAYTWSNNAESEWAEAGDNINVYGGTYSKGFNAAYLAADCTLVESTEGGYTVDQKKVAEYNGTQYTSLAQAILDANKAETKATVKLLDDVTLTNDLGIGGAVEVVLNLNKKTLTLDGAQIYTQGSAAVTINSGTIERTDTPASGNASNFAIQVMSGSSLMLGAGIGSTNKVTLDSTYGIYNVGGTLTVRYATINTDGWSIAVSDSASKTGEVYIGRGMGGNTKTVITSESGNVLGTMVNSKPNVTIDYGTLTSNGTAWDAGVVYWASEGTLTITGGIFNASSAGGSTAAAVYQKNGTVKISGATTKLLGSNALVVKAGDGSTGTMVTELSGGTYSTKPEGSWLVEGKEIHQMDDGLYKIEGPYVVEVTLEDGTVRSFDSWSKAFYSTAAQEHNATVKLLTNIETTSTVTTWATVTVDFNGHTLTVNGSGVAAITVLTKGTAGNVTLKDPVGSGGMVTTGIYGVTVRGTGATATVESGSYNCTTTAVQVENGAAYIKSGTFKTDDANKSYLLNCIDEAFKAGTAKIEVIGGTFYGFDPSADPEGESTTYVKTGYVSTNNGDGTYTVEEHKPVEYWTGFTVDTKIGKTFATLDEAMAYAAKQTDASKRVVIAGDYTLTKDTSIPENVYVDVMGKLTIPAGVTMTVPANAKRLGAWTGGTIEGEGMVLIEGRGNDFGESKVMINGTMSTDMLIVPEGYILAKNSNSYFAAKALFEITYSDGKVEKSGKDMNLTDATKVKLLEDVTDFARSFGSTDKLSDNFILDLGGHTLSGKTTASTNVLEISVPMTIQNGTIKYQSNNTGCGALKTSADVTISSDAIIDGGVGYAIWTDGYGHTLTVNGTIKTDGAYAITSNGSENGGNIADCDITVNDGAVISAPKGIAIYHPELGTVTINGGDISGHTGIEICAGKLVVSGGSITSTGDNWDATGSQNAILDGAAISIIDRNYPGGTPTAEITGGTIKATGTGAQAVKAYDYTDNTVKEWSTVGESVNISGGTFSTEVDKELCADGYEAIRNTDGTYSVKKPSSSSGSSSSRSSVTAPKADNGTVTVTPSRASKGDTVTITVKPDSGYVLDDLTVTDKDGNELTLTDKGDGKYTFTMPKGEVTVKAAFKADSTSTAFFDDVAADSYYYEAVKWAVEKGITSGVGNGLFGSNDPCTRAQIVTFLWRAAGSPEPKALSSFSDVPADAWYAKAVAWAVENGVTAGVGDGLFGSDDTCTRAQSVTFLFKALKATAKGQADFKDVSASDWYAKAVAWAVENGVTAGVGGGLFGSGDDCTRAQIVTFLFKAYNK